MVTTCVNLYATRSHGNVSADHVAMATPVAFSPMLQLTVAVGLSLLLLNLLIFAGVCYQREKTRCDPLCYKAHNHFLFEFLNIIQFFYKLITKIIINCT